MQLGTLVRLPQTYKNLQRVREILGVVAKWGFGSLVVQLELENAVERARNLVLWRRNREAAVRYTTEERIRRAFEELGPTFVKLGQILATRPDLIPMSLVLELRKLQDDVPPFDGALARRQVEASLGRPIEQVFARFDREPLAAASIAQVHAAVLASGEEVVVKVQRPQVEQQVRLDIAAMAWIAPRLVGRIPVAALANPPALVELFAETIIEELDFRLEAENMLDIARVLQEAGQRAIIVPRPHPELVTRRVLVMERLSGFSTDDVEGMRGAGIDTAEVVRSLYIAFIEGAII